MLTIYVRPIVVLSSAQFFARPLELTFGEVSRVSSAMRLTMLSIAPYRHRREARGGVA